METYNTQPPARKLKDSCNFCSASKLRCDKQKPTCSRCANLNHPCTYSPARRAGRPHRVRRSTSQSQSQTPQQCFGTPDAKTNSNYLVEPTGIPGQTDNEMGCDNGWVPSTYTTSHHQNSNQPQPAEISSSRCNIMNTRHDADTAETTDCTTIALSIVEQLEMTKGRRSAAPTPTYGGSTSTSTSNSSSSSSSALTITEACQRLLTILMCPCSEQADVALLVASGCISLMNVVHGSASTGADSDRGGSVSLDVLSSSDGTSNSHGHGHGHGSCEQEIAIPMWSRPQSSSRNLASDGQSQMGDLSKIAKVILQFTDRYCQDTITTKGGARWEHTAWVVAPVAALLRDRLQSVTHGVARSLVF